MALYEHVVVTRPDISPQQVDALVEDITKIVTERKGKIGKTEYWGLRNLAYPIKKSRKAHYSLLNIDAPGDVIAELERRHRINEDVLRFLTVKVDALSEEPSPVIARKDRDDRGKRDRDEGGFGGGGFGGGRDRDRGDRPPRDFGDRPPREDRGDRPPRPPRDRGDR
ncbi:MAG TPA: 30S ribosomal protein S6 [Hyphomonadaceae bacterium]|nr:30S ribosomal protein S6 [Hyphomonadaceae bacterium]